MIRSMFSGVSALRAHQTMMDVVGNNIANVNTIGFKAGQVSFEDLFNQTLQGAVAPFGGRGGVNQQQIGLGSRVATILDIYTQGSLQVTGKSTDLAIQGDGFFVLSNGAQNYYSRAGNFAFDKEGSMVNPSNGYKVQGWVADSTGAINTNAAVGDVVIPLGTTITPRSTTSIKLEGNIDSKTAAQSSYNTSITVYDSLGGAHDLNIMFSAGTVKGERHVKSAGGAWAMGDNFSVYNPAGVANVVVTNAQTGATYTAGADYMVAGPMITVMPGSAIIGVSAPLKVDYTYTSPAVNTWNWVATIDGHNLNDPLDPNYDGGRGQISFTNKGEYSTVAITNPIDFMPTGTSSVTITPDFSKLTQYAASGTAAATSQDGYTSGSVSGFTISDSGVLNGVFTNGVQRNLGQIAMANFANPTALYKMGDNLLTSSNNSGNPLVGVANMAGRGSLISGSLEMSNVDLAKEFTNLIIAQRGFQANARVITTSDEVLTDLVALKR